MKDFYQTYRSLIHKIYAIVLSGMLIFSFSKCSGGSNLPPEVCTWGNAICEVGNYVCENVPGVPPEICTYFNLACLNLQILCESEPGTDRYNTALSSMQLNSDLLHKWINKQHQLADTTSQQ